MFSTIRQRFTYANVAMTLALVFAMSGGAYAAGKYLITSTKQISPKVLKSLKGANGKNGATGATGAAGLAGPAGPAGATGPGGPGGPQGPAGTAGTNGTNGTNGKQGAPGEPWTPNSQLPVGATETGAWTFGPFKAASTGSFFSSPYVTAPIASFTVQLAAPLDAAHVIYVKAGATTPEHCTGSVAEPGAESGYLCVFANEEVEIEGAVVEDPAHVGSDGAGKAGAVGTFLAKSAAETFQARGTWAVTG